MVVPGSLVDGRFEIEGLVGTGGMGSVFRALDRRSGAPVAVKVLDPLANEQRFWREIRILAGLSHPAIVRYLAHGIWNERPYLAMEWLEGEDLAARIERAVLSVEECVALAARVAEAAGFAHAHGVVHRDVKPANVFLPGGDVREAKLLDFGVARAAHGTRGATRSGAVLGTPAYMAPEQASGAGALDARADVFALGCVLFEALARRPAFAGANVMAVLAKVLFEEPPRVRTLRPDVPAALDALVARMLAKDPAARPADGAAVARALASIALDTDGGATLELSRPAVAALGRAEQRLVTVLVASPRGEEGLARADTLPAASSAAETLRGVRALLAAAPARIEHLVDGSAVALFAGFASAVDQAAQAARCALALSRSRPGVTIAVATGRALVTGPLPVGEVIDRAAELVRERGDASAIVVDELTAGLLPPELVLSGDRRGLVLEGEREAADAARTVLGRATRCVGREKELAFLRGVFEESASEPVARAVLVTAPPGMGKSRLRIELLARLGDAAEVWTARGDALAAGSPLGLIGRVLRYALGLRAGEPPLSHERKIRARLARFTPELERAAPFVGELAGAPFEGAEPQLAAARRDPQLMGDRMRAAWIELLRAETGERPLVLVLEDLHWGDRASLDYVDAALRALADRPLVVLALARPEVHEVFPALFAQRDLHELRLAPLTPGAAQRLVREVLGAGVDDEVAREIARQSGGNAFYLEELTRAYGEGDRTHAPTTVVAMAQARLEALDAESRRALRAASVFGEVFWRGAVAELLGAGPDRVRPLLDALVEREVLVRRGAGRFLGEEELAFGHALVREAAYAALTDEDRALGHALAAAWLEREGENDPTTLAEHYERGGRADRAAEWYGRAAEQALEGGDLEAAIARAERGVGCGASGEALGALRLAQATAHDWRGENPEAVRRGREAMERLERGGAPWHRAACAVAVAARRMGEGDELARIGLELAGLEPGAFAGAAERACAGRVALQLAIGGFGSIAAELLELAGRADAPATDALAETWLWAARGMMALLEGDPTRLLHEADRTLSAVVATGDLRAAANFHLYACTAANAAGGYDHGERWARAGIELALRVGSATIVPPLRLELAKAGIGLGRLAEARALLATALEEIRDRGDRFQEGRVEQHFAASFLAAGELGEAERRARRAVELTEFAPPFRRQAAATLASVLLAQARAEEALAALARDAGGEGPEAPWDDGALVVRAEALWALGRREEAREALRGARDRLRARADAFADPSWRGAYLAVPQHARTLALAAEWAV